MNLLTDNWISLTNGSKTNIDDVLDESILNISDLNAGYQTATIIFMLLKSYLKEINEDDFIDFLQTPAEQFNSGKLVTIDQLIYSQPRENAKKLNKDHFIKRGSITCLCEACCTQSIITTSLFTGAAGIGYSPSLYSGSLIMFKSGKTIREIINNNKINEKYKFGQLFSTPYKIRLINSSHSECSLCGAESECYTHFMRESNGKILYPDDLPLVARIADGRRYICRRTKSEIQLLSEINNRNILLPNNIVDLKINEPINIFSLIYDKGKLVDIFDHYVIYDSINVKKEIEFLAEQISTFYQGNIDDIRYRVADAFPQYLHDYSINESAVKIFARFIPDDITALHGTKQQLVAMAINRVVEKYES